MPAEDDDLTDTPLSPDQAVLEESEHVLELPENRYLVSTSRIDDQTADQLLEEAEDDGEAEASAPTGGTATDSARATLRSSLSESEATYAVEVVAVLEGSVHTDRIETDDVVDAFDDLNRTFAAGVGGDDVSITDAVEILVTESSLTDGPQPIKLDEVLEAFDLGPTDRIADLIDAVERR